jgi:hypothetical protein
MIDHIGVGVSDFAASKLFYRKALGAIGYQLVLEVDAALSDSGMPGAGFGVPAKPDFWIGGVRPTYRQFTWRFESPVGRRSMPFIGRRSRPAGVTTVHPVCGRTITPVTTAPSCSIRTDTTSRRSASRPPEAAGRGRTITGQAGPNAIAPRATRD